MLLNFSGKCPFPDGQINICRIFSPDPQSLPTYTTFNVWKKRRASVRGDENLDK